MGEEEGTGPRPGSAFRLDSSLRIEFVLCYRMTSYQEMDPSR